MANHHIRPTVVSLYMLIQDSTRPLVRAVRHPDATDTDSKRFRVGGEILPERFVAFLYCEISASDIDTTMRFPNLGKTISSGSYQRHWSYLRIFAILVGDVLLYSQMKDILLPFSRASGVFSDMLPRNDVLNNS